MASTYSNLKLQLMTTGENSSTWGDITNVNLGTALEEAIVSSASVTFASADITLTLTNLNTTQTARNLRLNLIGTSGGARNLIVPTIPNGKNYIVNNGCADAVTVKNATGTGIAVPAGKTMYLYNDGTNVGEAITYINSFSTGALAYTTSLTGSTGIVNLGSGQVYKDVAGLVGLGTTAPVTKLDIRSGDITVSRTAAGLAGDAAINFGNGSTNYIFGGNTSNVMAFWTNGVEAGRFTSAGNFGVGTSAPATKLDVRSGDITVSRTATGLAGDAAINFGNGGTNYIFGGNTSNIMSFGVNSVEAGRFDNTGNFGVGVTVPSGRVHAKGANCIIYSEGSSGYGAFYAKGFGTGNGFIFLGNTTNGEQARVTSIDGGTMTFSTGAGVEKMRIDTSGNVSIGLASAAPYRLGVQANTAGADGMRVQNLSASASATAIIQIGNDLNAAASAIEVNSNANSTNFGGVNALVVRNGLAAPIALATGGSERLRISGTGDAYFAAVVAPESTLSVGYRGVPQNAKTANYTLALTDSGGHIYLTGSTASQSITIPANASIAFPIGTAISIISDSTVNWSVAITTDTMQLAGTTTTGTRTLASGAVATLIKVTATKWFISGAGVS